jgi:hypothetical protein
MLVELVVPQSIPPQPGLPHTTYEHCIQAHAWWLTACTLGGGIINPTARPMNTATANSAAGKRTTRRMTETSGDSLLTVNDTVSVDIGQ